jgi:hypothetical protein
VEERRRLRRRADSATVAGDQLLLYRPEGTIARIAVVVDQLDDAGLRTPLVEDVLAAFPHAELHAVTDLRAAPSPIAERAPVVWNASSTRPRRSWRRRRVEPEPSGELGDYDLVLRLGDRRSRGFVARTDALDLTYILDLADPDGDGGAPRLGSGLRDRCAMRSADRVWCGTRRLLATLRRRWKVDAELLYPPAETPADVAAAGPRRVVLAVADGVSPAWNARLDTLARWRDDLDVVKLGGSRPRRDPGRCRIEPATPSRFAELVGRAVAVVMPPGDVFDPRAVWAAAAGVPVVTPISSAHAETVHGLERREPTGVLLDDSTDTALADGVAFVERHPTLFERERLRRHAERWSRHRFRQTLKALVLDAWCGHVADRTASEGHVAGTAVERAGTPAL